MRPWLIRRHEPQGPVQTVKYGRIKGKMFGKAMKTDAKAAAKARKAAGR